MGMHQQINTYILLSIVIPTYTRFHGDEHPFTIYTIFYIHLAILASGFDASWPPLTLTLHISGTEDLSRPNIGPITTGPTLGES